MPGLVRYHYKHPVDLLPSLRDVRRAQSVLNRKEVPFCYDRFLNNDYDSETVRNFKHY